MIAPRKSLEPWIFDEVEYYPHQIEGIRIMARKGSCLLADEMGLGKSLQTLTVFGIDVVKGWAEKLLVVCPVTLKGNWEDEVRSFTRFTPMILGQIEHPTIPNKTVTLGPAQRSKQIEQFAAMEGPRILIVNYEQVVSHLKELNELKFDMIATDEAHYVKNPKSKRTKAWQALRAKRHFLLTGSPMLNHVNELWTLLNKISPGEFPNYYSFLNRYAVYGGWSNKQIVGVKNEKELTERLQNVMVRRLKKDVLNLKDPQIIQKKVDLSPEQRKLYDEVANDMKITLPGQPEPQDIENALTKFLRLKQICGTTATIDGHPDSSYKLDLALDMIQELIDSGEKVVVFTQFRGVLGAMCERLNAAKIPNDFLHGDVDMSYRVPIVRQWSADPKPGVLVCMLQVAGVGLNMTAARHMIFLDKLFVPMLNKQAIDRLHRIGQSETQPVMVFELIAKNTIESRIEAILKIKKKLFNEIVETSDWKRALYQAMLEEDE